MRRAAPDAALLARAGAVLGLPPEKVLFETGYDAANKARDRLAAAEAELRVVVFLEAQGFRAIRLVPRSERPTADIVAEKAGLSYAFEVRCVTRKSSLSSAGDGAGAVLAAKVADKMRQAGVSRRRGGLDRRAVALVLETVAPGGAGRDLRALAREAYEGAGSPPDGHVCLLAGDRHGAWPPWAD